MTRSLLLDMRAVSSVPTVDKQGRELFSLEPPPPPQPPTRMPTHTQWMDWQC